MVCALRVSHATMLRPMLQRLLQCSGHAAKSISMLGPCCEEQRNAQVLLRGAFAMRRRADADLISSSCWSLVSSCCSRRECRLANSSSISSNSFADSSHATCTTVRVQGLGLRIFSIKMLGLHKAETFSVSRGSEILTTYSINCQVPNCSDVMC